MSVAVVSVAWGDAYAQFVPHWWTCVELLNPAPDEIVIAHHPDDDTGVKDLPVTLVECAERSLPRMLNAAIQAAKSEWIQQCPLDDWLTPDALTILDDIDGNTDLIVAGAQSVRKAEIWMGDWETIWGPPPHYRMNHHCPFRKSLWERIGGYSDHHWCDWAFFLRADAASAVVEHRRKVTLMFGDDHHLARLSDLGGHLADAEIDALKRELRP